MGGGQCNYANLHAAPLFWWTVFLLSQTRRVVFAGGSRVEDGCLVRDEKPRRSCCRTAAGQSGGLINQANVWGSLAMEALLAQRKKWEAFCS